MDLVRLEVLHQVVDFLMLGDEVGLANQLLPAKFVTSRQVRHQILHIERTTDVVDILVIDRNTRKTRLDNRLLDRFVVGRQLHGRNIDTRFHDGGRLRIDKIDNTGQHHALLIALGLGQIDGIGQLVERNLTTQQSVFADAVSGTHQNHRDGAEHRLKQMQRTCRKGGKASR